MTNASCRNWNPSWRRYHFLHNWSDRHRNWLYHRHRIDLSSRPSWCRLDRNWFNDRQRLYHGSRSDWHRFNHDGRSRTSWRRLDRYWFNDRQRLYHDSRPSWRWLDFEHGTDQHWIYDWSARSSWCGLFNRIHHRSSGSSWYKRLNDWCSRTSWHKQLDDRKWSYRPGRKRCGWKRFVCGSGTWTVSCGSYVNHSSQSS